MTSAYELAFLSNFSYSSNTGQSTRVFEIPLSKTGSLEPKFLNPTLLNKCDPSKSIWAISRDVGLVNNMYAATFENMQTHEKVYSFRGTRMDSFWGALTDVATDALHLLVRRSPYITAAKKYINADPSSDSFITGHSLGGYIAISMAFHFRNKRIATFNAPHVMGGLGNLVDFTQSTFGKNFKTNKIICYNSKTDFASGLTSFFGMGKLSLSNIKYENISNGGIHTLAPMLRQLRRRGVKQINWKKRRN